jgi:hypothetical protein
MPVIIGLHWQLLSQRVKAGAELSEETASTFSST